MSLNIDDTAVRPTRRALRLEGEAGASSKENDQKEYWFKELYKELRRIDAPALEELEHCVEERHLHLALAGCTRYITLKRYIKVLRSFFTWVVAQIIFSRYEERCGPTVPPLTSDVGGASVRDYVVKILSKDKPPTKRALRFPAVFMEAFEHMVEDESRRLDTEL